MFALQWKRDIGKCNWRELKRVGNEVVSYGRSTDSPKAAPE
jgi:hypothetical protein